MEKAPSLDVLVQMFLRDNAHVGPHIVEEVRRSIGMDADLKGYVCARDGEPYVAVCFQEWVTPRQLALYWAQAYPNGDVRRV